MKVMRLTLAILLLSTLSFFARPLAAQSIYGQVSGRLTSGSGTPVSGGLVSLTAAQTGAVSRTRSGSDGNFALNNLTPDLYQIDVQADGFKRVQASIAVSADSTTSVNVPLQVGDSNVVSTSNTASASALKLDRTDVSTQFDTLAVNDLPLLDRNVTQLQLLVPGAARGQLFIPANQNPQGGQPVNVNGQHFSGSAFQLDGTENRDPLEGIIVINPTLDSVREMKVTTQGYNADFGQATAGVVTVQTKTGSNAWHGDAFEFRRTGFGQSVDPFDPAGVALPTSRSNIFGGSFGGPILRNKLFVFGDYQGTRSSQGANVLLSVPTANVRSTCLGSTAPSGVPCNLSDYGQFITGPLTHGSNNNVFPFMDCSNPSMECNIPNSGSTLDDHVSDQAVAVLSLLPLPNHTPSPNDPNCPSNTGQIVCDNYLTSGQEVFNADQFDGRADYNASSRLRLFGRYSFGQFYDNGAPGFSAQAGGPGADPSGFAGVAKTRNQGISSGFTYTLSPRVLTDFRFGYFRYRLNVNAPNSIDTSTLGIHGISAADTGNPFAVGVPDFEVPGQQGLFAGGDYLRLGYSNQANDCTCPLLEREQQFQFVNNWTLISGRHTIKWGADLRFLQNYRLESDRSPTGSFSSAPSQTGLSTTDPNSSGLGLATFLIGDITSFQRSTSGPAATDAGEHQKRFGFYGEDTWRINPRLTFNYGLRWEIYFPQTVTNAGGFLLPNLSNHDPSQAFFNTPSATSTSGGVLGSLTNFAPRVGFGYLINPTTVIRAGYGRSFDAGYGGDLFGIAATQNPPVAAIQNVQSLFNLSTGPPAFSCLDGPQYSCNNVPMGSRFSLLDLATANKASGGNPASGAVIYALPARVRVPTVDSWNLTVQHELSSHLYFEVGYVGNKGTHVFPDADLPSLQTLGAFYLLSQPTLDGLIIPAGPGPNYPNCKGGNNGAGVFPGNPSGGPYCLANPTLRTFYTNINPNLFKIRYFGNGANDNYNSLQAKVSKTFSHGYSFLAHYTWSKGLDYDQDYFAISPQYGPASFDIKHRFVMTNIWDLPLGRGKAWLGGIGPGADRFVGGWSISAITLWRSGFPFTPSYLQTNCAADTDTSAPCQPDLVAPAHISGSREQYFTTTGGVALAGTDCVDSGKFCGVDTNGNAVKGQTIGPWQRPGAGQIGDVGRNSFSGPGFFQADLGLAKVVFITEGTALRFRADAFNVFNRVNLGNPNTCVDCTGGGVISALAPGALQRTLQFSVKFEF